MTDQRYPYLGKIIAVDFDGTICENKYPECGDPNVMLIHALKTARSKGAHLILWTCRTNDALCDAIEYCAKNDLYFDSVNQDAPIIQSRWGDHSRKIYADIYIDDKAAGLDSWMFELDSALKKEHSKELDCVSEKNLA